jgi:hypothetical protein
MALCHAPYATQALCRVLAERTALTAGTDQADAGVLASARSLAVLLAGAAPFVPELMVQGWVLCGGMGAGC